jgi:hypothetical protein
VAIPFFGENIFISFFLGATVLMMPALLNCSPFLFFTTPHTIWNLAVPFQRVRSAAANNSDYQHRLVSPAAHPPRRSRDPRRGARAWSKCQGAFDVGGGRSCRGVGSLCGSLWRFIGRERSSPSARDPADAVLATLALCRLSLCPSKSRVSEPAKPGSAERFYEWQMTVIGRDGVCE